MSASRPPLWFETAIRQEPKHAELIVEGATVHYRSWGDPLLPGIVLVHGGGAHSGWWDHIAPLLITHHIVALDLSGHGKSGHREAYSIRQWGREVRAVAFEAGLFDPVLIGHSMGGRVVVAAAVTDDPIPTAVVCIDSPLRLPPGETPRAHRPRREPRRYPTVEAAVEAFRTIPPQSRVLPYVREHVARQSVRPVEDGWIRRFDSHVFGLQPALETFLPQLPAAVPLAFLHCTEGLVDGAALRKLRLLRPEALTIELLAAGHHPMLDRPIELITALRSLLAVWKPGQNRVD